MLADLVRDGKINFSSYGRKLDSYPEDFGEYNWELARYLFDNSGQHMAIRGEGLEDYLKDFKGLDDLTSFLVQLWTLSWNNRKYDNMGFLVDVDIEKLDKFYKRPETDPISNGLGMEVCDAASWVPEITYFEKLWNFELCNRIGGAIGYPGYEYPRSEEAFRYAMRNHALNFMIGTKEQLDRYEIYATGKIKLAFEITKKAYKSPKTIFETPNLLYSLEFLVHDARVIAENITAFKSM